MGAGRADTFTMKLRYVALVALIACLPVFTVLHLARPDMRGSMRHYQTQTR